MTISELIAFVEKEGMPDGLEPEGVPADVLEDLTLPGGEALPDDLREWLAYSARSPELFVDAENGDYSWKTTTPAGFFDEEQDFLMDAMGDDYDGDLTWIINRIPRDLRDPAWIRLKDALTGEPVFLVLRPDLPVLTYARQLFNIGYESFTKYLIEHYGDD